MKKKMFISYVCYDKYNDYIMRNIIMDVDTTDEDWLAAAEQEIEKICYNEFDGCYIIVITNYKEYVVDKPQQKKKANSIEELPKFIKFNNVTYELRMWVTAYGNLCLGYVSVVNDKQIKLFSIIVDNDNITDIVKRNLKFSDPSIEYIFNATTFTDAVNLAFDIVNTYKLKETK